MTTDLDRDLDDELRVVARALVAEAPEVPTFEPPIVSSTPALRRHTALAAAAALIVVAGAGGLFLLRDRGDDTATIPEEPGEITWPAVLPIVNGDSYVYIDALPVDQVRVAQATLAKRVDGALVDPVVVEVGPDYATTHNGAEPVDIVGVFGRTAHVYTALDNVTPLTVKIGDDPYVAVSGVDPMAFLNRVDEDFVDFDVPDDGGPITMEFGSLPDGYEVIYNEPEPDEVTAFVQMDLYSDSSQTERWIVVGIGPTGIGRDASPVNVDGISAWLSTDGAHTQVSWPVEGDTFAVIQATSPDEALEVARSVQWVTLDEWAEHYDVPVEEIEPGQPVSYKPPSTPQTSTPS